MTKEKRELVPSYEILPPTSAAPASRLPTLPRDGGFFARLALERRTRHTHAATDLLNAQSAHAAAFADLAKSIAAAERALFTLDHLPQLLEEEWGDGSAERQYARDLARRDYQLACEQRAQAQACARLDRDASEREHARDTELRDAQHKIQLADAEHTLARTRADIEALTKPAPPMSPPQSAPADPAAVLRAAINVARQRGDFESARRFEAALAALAPRLATGT